MYPRLFLALIVAGALAAPASLVENAVALDRVFVGPGTDYYTDAHWQLLGAFPSAQFSERAVIGTTGANTPPGLGLLNANVTANLVPTGQKRQSAGLVLGREPTSSGTLTVTGGNVAYAFTAQAATAGANGAVYLGLFYNGSSVAQGGIGTLNLSGNAALTATGMFVEGETVGGNRSSVNLSGSSSVTLGPVLNVFNNTTNGIGNDNVTFGRNLTITGPNVNFTNTGNIRFLGASNYTAAITSATAHSPIKTTGNVNLAGTLTVNFSGLGTNPAVGQTWNLIDYGGNLLGNFSNAPINGEVAVTGLPQPVPLGAAFKLRRANGGANGRLVQLVQEALLVLRVNRDTGELSLTNPHAGPIQLEGYEIRSPLGSLLPSYKGISGAPAGDAGWDKVPMNSVNGLAELKRDGELNFTSIPSLTLGAGAGRGFDKFAVAGDVANFGTDGEDLQFWYATPEGIVRGHVQYIGTKFENNLVLRVNPNTGAAFLKNDSQVTLTFDGYSILSSTNSLNASWNGGLGGAWQKTLSTSALSETNLTGSTTLSPGAEVGIGNIASAGALASAAAQAGLSMEFILAAGLTGGGSPTGDYNSDGIVDAADYVLWRKNNINGAQGYADWRANFGATGGAGGPETEFRLGSIVFDTTAGAGAGLSALAVPEPSAACLMILGFGAVLTMSRARLRRVFVSAPRRRTLDATSRQRGGCPMSRTIHPAWPAVALGALLLCAAPASAATQGIKLLNYDFEDPGPPGVKTVAYDATGNPIPGIIPGWTFTCCGTETWGDDVPGDSGTEGGGNPGQEMLLSVNDGKAYQVAMDFTIQSIPGTQVYKFAFDAHDVFTINANAQGLPDSAQLTVRFFYGPWAEGQRTLLTEAVDLAGGWNRYEFTIPHNSPLLAPAFGALGQTIGIEFTTTSKNRNPEVDKSWAGIDNVVMQIAPVLPGDINGDGLITAADYDILRANLQRSSCLDGIRGCPFEANGELTGDRTVNLNDFRAFKTIFAASGTGTIDFSAVGAGVPEPTSLVLLLAAAAFIAPARFRRRIGHA